jgi:hypothetical protein
MPVDENRQGGGKMEYNDRMKTKPLTFLLALILLLSVSKIVNAKQKFGDYAVGTT